MEVAERRNFKKIREKEGNEKVRCQSIFSKEIKASIADPFSFPHIIQFLCKNKHISIK